MQNDPNMKMLEDKINSLSIHNELTKVAFRSGVMAIAIPDLLNRAEGELTYDHDFKIIGPNGESLQEWLKATKEKAPHLWLKNGDN